MLKQKINNVPFGIITGVVLPVIGFFIYYLVAFRQYEFSYFLTNIFQKKLTSPVFYICMFPVFLLFFIGIWQGYEKFARGILAVTLIFVIVIVILHFT